MSGNGFSVNSFGFHLQYNKLYKTEYLPGKVKYNQFFFVIILAFGCSTTLGKVSH